MVGGLTVSTSATNDRSIRVHNQYATAVVTKLPSSTETPNVVASQGASRLFTTRITPAITQTEP